MNTVWTVKEYKGAKDTVVIAAHHGDDFDEELELTGNFRDHGQKLQRAREICNQLNGGDVHAEEEFVDNRQRLRTAYQKPVQSPVTVEFIKQAIIKQWMLWDKPDTYREEEWAHITASSPLLALDWKATYDEKQNTMDSLDAVEMVMFLEDEYGVELTDEEADKLRTIQDVVDVLKKHTGREQ